MFRNAQYRKNFICDPFNTCHLSSILNLWRTKMNDIRLAEWEKVRQGQWWLNQGLMNAQNQAADIFQSHALMSAIFPLFSITKHSRGYASESVSQY